MSRTTIFLSKDDHRVLSHLINGITNKSEVITRLRGELARAIVLEFGSVPKTSIGLNSWFQLEDMDSGELEEYTLTLPAHADLDQQRLSILAPLGVGMLGYEQGDEVEWPTPGGIRRVKVLKVERQPQVSEPKVV